MLALKTVWKLCLIYIQADDVEVFVSFLTYFVIFFFIQFLCDLLQKSDGYCTRCKVCSVTNLYYFFRNKNMKHKSLSCSFTKVMGEKNQASIMLFLEFLVFAFVILLFARRNQNYKKKIIIVSKTKLRLQFESRAWPKEIIHRFFKLNSLLVRDVCSKCFNV